MMNKTKPFEAGSELKKGIGYINKPSLKVKD
jgi:hypothetical protein